MSIIEGDVTAHNDNYTPLNQNDISQNMFMSFPSYPEN